jgi:hypothetical protein
LPGDGISRLAVADVRRTEVEAVALVLLVYFDNLYLLKPWIEISSECMDSGFGFGE